MLLIIISGIIVLSKGLRVQIAISRKEQISCKIIVFLILCFILTLATTVGLSSCSDETGADTPTFKLEDGVLYVSYDGEASWQSLGNVKGEDGAPGKDGKDGENGKDGANGKDGVGITSANINAEGQLVLSFSDGKTVNLDKVVGMNGTDGIGISSSVINSDGELVITYTNSQTANLGVVIGAKGDKGDKGDQGETGATGATGATGNDGVSITKTEINNKGELVITLSDNTVSNLGVVVGAKGDKGETGATGATGATGDKGDKGDKGNTGAAGADGVGIAKIEKTSSDGNVDTYTITLTNGTTYTFTATNGTNGTNGVDGKDGTDGEDGQTPYIGENGNWWIGDTDTGVKAAGDDGKDGAIIVATAVGGTALIINIALIAWTLIKKKRLF